MNAPRLLIALAVSSSALLAACGGSRSPSSYADPVDASDHAGRTAAAKDTARLALIEDVYAEWQRAHLVFQGELEDRGADASAIERPAGDDPVRSLDALLERLDPEAHDPELRGPLEKWSEACREYDRRLRELGNDPTRDPRSPLVAAE